MIIISFSTAEWQLIVGIIWRIVATIIIWAVVHNFTHAFLGTK